MKTLEILEYLRRHHYTSELGETCQKASECVKMCQNPF